MLAQDRFRLGEDLRLLLTGRRASKICRCRYQSTQKRSLLRQVAQILPVVTEDAEGRQTTAVADDSAPASSAGLRGLLANLDSVILHEVSADRLNEECQRPHPKKDERDFLLGQ